MTYQAQGQAPAIPVPRRSQKKEVLMPAPMARPVCRGFGKSQIRSEGSAFQKQSTAQAQAIVELLSRVTKLRKEVDPVRFRTIFLQTVQDKLQPAQLRMVLGALSSHIPELAIPRGSSRRASYRSKSSRRKGKRRKGTSSSLSVNMGDLPRRSPRLSPRTPVLASALVNLAQQFEFNLNKPAENAGTSEEKKKPRRRPPPLPVPVLTLGGENNLNNNNKQASPFTLVRRSPRFTPQRQQDELARKLKEEQELLLAGAAWDAPSKRRLDFPSPVPLRKPRRPGMPRVAVIRKDRGKRKRRLTQKAATLAKSAKRKTETLAVPAQKHGITSSERSKQSRNQGLPMSPGRQFLLSSFIAPVSPLLRGSKSSQQN